MNVREIKMVFINYSESIGASSSLNFKIRVRSQLHCSSKCIGTQQCSAYKFDEHTGECELGSNLKLKDASTASSSLVGIFSHASGKGLLIRC